MLRSHITTTLKYFRNQKTFLVINLFGLTVGLVACYFSFLYVRFELSYDSYHEHADKIYRVATDVKTSKGIEYGGSCAPLGPAIEESFPEVQSTRLNLDYLIIQNDKGLINEEKIAYADATLFKVFSFPLVKGNPSNVLNAPFNIVLTETAAAKYFGTNDPVGKTLLINGKDQANVTGVMKDIPHNSHFRVDMLVSLSTLFNVWNPSMAQNWKGLRSYTYLLIRDERSVPLITEGISDLLKKSIAAGEREYIPSLEPLQSLYLHGKPRGHRAGSSVTGNATNVYIFSTVAVFILIMACLNFVNLSTAFSMQRAKEVGVKKILGATRSTLIFQFLTDAVVLSVVSYFLALYVISMLLPFFNQIAGKYISSSVFEQPEYPGLLFLVSIAIGLLSGIYPSVFLSGFKSITVLKGRFVSSTRGIQLRKTLVTFQFLISFILVVATTVIFRQLHYMQHQDLGFNKDHMMVIDFQFDEKAGSEFTKQQLTAIHGVTSASLSSAIPGRANHKLETHVEDINGEMEDAHFNVYFVDFSFIEQYGITMTAGRAFSNLISSDSTQAMIINESAARALGFSKPDDALGKRYEQWGRKGNIIGVVKDFHFQSFREEVQPLTMQVGAIYTFLTLQVSQNEIQKIITDVAHTWLKINPNAPMSYFFADEGYDGMYVSEKRFSSLFICLVTIALAISCLGLFGLSAYSTVQKTKEIGIRKVLGASAYEIVTLLTKDFLRIIAASISIGIPVAWLIMSEWLGEYAYRIDLSMWVFILAAAMLGFVSLATICIQTIKAANTNPVTTLKTE
jgi:putative ABC transport system permease protein